MHSENEVQSARIPCCSFVVRMTHALSPSCGATPNPALKRALRSATLYFACIVRARRLA